MLPYRSWISQNTPKVKPSCRGLFSKPPPGETFQGDAFAKPPTKVRPLLKMCPNLFVHVCQFVCVYMFVTVSVFPGVPQSICTCMYACEKCVLVLWFAPIPLLMVHVCKSVCVSYFLLIPLSVWICMCACNWLCLCHLIFLNALTHMYPCMLFLGPRVYSNPFIHWNTLAYIAAPYETLYTYVNSFICCIPLKCNSVYMYVCVCVL